MVDFLKQIVAPAAGFAVGGPVGAGAAYEVANGGKEASDVASGASNIVSDYINAGANHYTPTPVPVPAPQYGGYNGGAADMSLLGLQGMRGADANGQGLYNSGYGALQSASYGAQENPYLSGNEAYSRGYDQAGGLQLDREAAMGMAPSQAAYLMQQGLNQGIANQYATMGGARGNAGIALAQGNAGANIANMQNQAYTAAGAQRASEMANARTAYNNDAQAMRQQDQNRLQMSNQMSQYNVTNASNIGNAELGGAQGYGNIASNYYGQAQQPYSQQLNADNNYANNVVQSGLGSQGLAAGIAQGNATSKAGQGNNLLNAGGSLIMHMGSGYVNQTGSGGGIGNS